MLKPTIVFILVISIAGYLYCSTAYKNVVKLEKSEGYHTFFISASWGLCLFILAFILISLVSLFDWAIAVGAIIKNVIGLLLPQSASDIELVNLISVLIVTLVLGWVIPHVINYFSDKNTGGNGLLNEWKRYASSDESAEYSTLCFKSFEYDLPICFTLSNNKVYIGYIREFGIKANDILILPVVSGYRCNDTLELKLTTDYEPVIKNILNEESKLETKLKIINTFIIAIPHREIVHAHLHDLEYKGYFDRYRFNKTQDDSNLIEQSNN